MTRCLRRITDHLALESIDAKVLVSLGAGRSQPKDERKMKGRSVYCSRAQLALANNWSAGKATHALNSVKIH